MKSKIEIELMCSKLKEDPLISVFMKPEPRDAAIKTLEWVLEINKEDNNGGEIK